MSTFLDRLQYYTAYRDGMATNVEIPLEQYLPRSQTGETFPTLCSLAHCQQKHGKDPRRPEDSNREPFPPSRRKEELFYPEDFEDVDKMAMSVTPKPTDDWQKLSRLLFRPGSSDLAKVRAAFRFTCTPIKNMPEIGNATDAYKCIQSRKHSEIFQNLIEASGVSYKRIIGYTKSADSEPGRRLKVNGVWHACYVEGEWRFVDANWGAASVRNYRSGRYSVIGNEGGLSSHGRSAGKDERGCNEFFFLTDPEKMAVSHFPKGDQSWQLLARPLTFAEFEQMPHYFDGCEHAMRVCYQLEPLNYPRNVILARPGSVEIFFQAPPKESVDQLEFDAVTSIADADDAADIRSGGGCHFDRLGFKNDVVRLTFEPPCAGKFALVVRLRRSQGSGKWCRFLTYIVHCPGSEESEAPFEPKIEVIPVQIPVGGPVPWADSPALSREGLAALRSYAKPPAIAFDAVRAVLLMLGFYEKRSRKWHRCLPLITAIPQAMYDVDVRKIDTHVAARSREMLNVSPEAKASLRQLGDASYYFYEWVETTTKLIMDKTRSKDFTPASLELQKELFGVTPEEDAHWDWEDERVRSDIIRVCIGFCEVCATVLYSNELKMHLHCRLPGRKSVTTSSGRHTART